MKKLILLFSLFGLTAFGALTNIPTYVETNTELHTADGFYLIDSKMPESLWALIINSNTRQLERLTPDRTNGVMTRLTVNDWLQVDGTLTVANTKATTLHGPLTVTDSKATFGGELEVNAITDLNGTLDVTGISTLRDDLIVTSDAPTYLDGALTVGALGGDQDTTILYGPLSVLEGQATSLSGALEVDGITTVNNNLNVSGTSILTTVAIDGGAIDSTAIGNTTRSSGNFTTLSSTGTTTLGDGTVDETTIHGKLTVIDNGIIANTVDINGGTIDATVIGSNAPTVGTFTTLTASSGITGNLSGNATTATTATNLSGGSVTATSGTFSGDLSVGGNVGLCNDPTNELSFFGGSGATAKTVNLPSEYVTNNLVYIITTNTTAELDALRVKCASLETQVQETRAKLRELISDLGAYNLIN